MDEQLRYVFREITSPDEFHDLFSLRYAVYSRTPGVRSLDSLDPVSRLDLDGFDRYSRHYGVFAVTEGGQKLVGCTRVTGPEVSPHAPVMDQVVRHSHTALERFHRPRAGSLPLMDFAVDREGMVTLLDDLAGSGDTVEVGRLILAPDVRVPTGGASVRLPLRLVSAMSGHLAFTAHVRHVLVNCLCHHTAFYSRFGFRAIGDALVGDVVKVILHGTPERLSPRARVECSRLADELRATGQATLAMASDRPRGVASRGLA